MKPSKTCDNKQLNLFSSTKISSWKAVVFPIFISKKIRQRKIEQMEKFKSLRQKVKPMIELSVESRLAEIDKRIPDAHLVRFIQAAVFKIDTSQIEAKYSFMGQKPYHPKLMLSILFYGYATGLRSSRKLEDKCIRDDYYKLLMQYYTPDHRTISDFRKDNLEQINNYFVDVLTMFSLLGYKNVGKIYIDGSKLKANATACRTKNKKGYKKWLSRIKEEVAEILKEAAKIDKEEDETSKLASEQEQEKLEKKLANRKYLEKRINEALEVMEKEKLKKINLTDYDANNMKKGGSKDIRPGYNCQAAVTEDGIITAAEAVTEANDRNQLEPMIEKNESNTGDALEEVTADSGYGSYENYEYLEDKGINGFVPDQYFQKYKSGEYEKEENRYHYTNFKYDELDDSYICPEGEKLVYWKTRTKKSKTRQWNHKVYRGVSCSTCSKRSLCTKSERRELLIDMRDPLLQVMRKKLLSEEGKLKYLMRQYLIEPVFGHLKYNVGYTHFLLRGLEKINGEFKLMCIGWNLKKMLKLGYTPEMVANL